MESKMKKSKKKMVIIVLSFCLLATNLFTSICKEKNICADNFNGDYILPNHTITNIYNS